MDQSSVSMRMNQNTNLFQSNHQKIDSKRKREELMKFSQKQVNLLNYLKGTPEFDSAIDASQQSSIVSESQENDEYRESNVGSRVQYPVIISTSIRPNGFYFYYLNRN